jgi:hypothetical protein
MHAALIPSKILLRRNSTLRLVSASFASMAEDYLILAHQYPVCLPGPTIPTAPSLACSSNQTLPEDLLRAERRVSLDFSIADEESLLAYSIVASPSSGASRSTLQAATILTVPGTRSYAVSIAYNITSGSSVVFQLDATNLRGLTTSCIVAVTVLRPALTTNLLVAANTSDLASRSELLSQASAGATNASALQTSLFTSVLKDVVKDVVVVLAANNASKDLSQNLTTRTFRTIDNLGLLPREALRQADATYDSASEVRAATLDFAVAVGKSAALNEVI